MGMLNAFTSTNFMFEGATNSSSESSTSLMVLTDCSISFTTDFIITPY